MNTKLAYLTRHAESLQNTGASTKGMEFKDIPLTERGVEESRVLACTTFDSDQLKVQPDKLISSDYQRARQTAAPTMERRGIDTLSIVPEIGEGDYLDPAKLSDHHFTNRGRLELTEQFWNEHTDPHYQHSDKTESFHRMVERFDSLINILREQDFECMLAFSHGLYLRGVLWRLMCNQNENLSNVDKPQFRKYYTSFDFPNCAVIPVRVIDDEIFVGSMIRLPPEEHWPALLDESSQQAGILNTPQSL